MPRNPLITTGLASVCAIASAWAAEPVANLAKGATVSASTTLVGYAAANAVDGVVSNKSRWVSAKDQTDAPWLEIHLAAEAVLGGVHLYSGDNQKSPVPGVRILFRQGERWIDIPSAVVQDNLTTALAIPFDATVAVRTTALRFVFGAGDIARIKEIAIWPERAEGIPPLGTGVSGEVAAGGHQAPSSTVVAPRILLNQSGFNRGEYKAFTAPTLADGTPFTIAAKGTDTVLHQGIISRNKGVFTAFEPAGSDEYVIRAGGEQSVPFRIGWWWLERTTYQNAVDFMIDSRHHVGNVRSVCKGSFGWRDDHHFAFEVNTLVPQYLSNPTAYERMPRQITYEMVKGRNGALEPYPAEAPDIIKLIHWGADVIVTQELDHEMMKEQLAYFVYAWPWLKRWLPEQNHTAVRAFLKETWGRKTRKGSYPYDKSTDHDLFAVRTAIGDTKGSLPPGHTVLPNLLMHAAAVREKDPDAGRHLDAAVRQVAWMIANLDWNDPMTTKGQRMSEHVTMTGMAWLLRHHPDQAPQGLKEKIAGWARIMVARSDNLWDFRKLSDTQWTPTGDKPQMWNEVGNVTGFPACLLAAMQVLDDAALKERLEQIAYAHFDNMAGRNPCGRHFGFMAAQEVEGVELGWYSRHPGGIGQLEKARFVLDGAPKNGHYPYSPEKGNISWTEGWVNFNTAFDLSLAYLAQHESVIRLEREGGQVRIRLRAPLNFDYAKAETALVQVQAAGGPVQDVTLTEVSADDAWFAGSVAATGPVTVSHGYGYMAVTAECR